MKKILAIAAVAALTAGVSAYAANPFSDVTLDDWAYQAVSDLSDQGVVEGYPGWHLQRRTQHDQIVNWPRSSPASWLKKIS